VAAAELARKALAQIGKVNQNNKDESKVKG